MDGENAMAELILQNLDEEILERLRQTAAEHGTTAEEEAKSILDSHFISTPNKRQALLKARSIRSRTAGRTHTNSIQLKREIYESEI